MRLLFLIAVLVASALSGRSFAAAYETADYRWRAMPVAYCVNLGGMPLRADGQPILTAEDFLAMVQAAFQRWQDLPGSEVSFVSQGLCAGGYSLGWDSVNSVGWAQLSGTAAGKGAVTLQLFSQEKVLRGGELYELLESDIYLSADLSTAPEYVRDVLPRILLHEVGHFIGLEHSSFACSVMLDASLNDICQDDIEGAAALYP